eukprot:GFYU01019348.1.p1 GENE.GFYU01019348.1~~GFYU01019348.1.p1  ORF type:complete len:693 (-),score=131.72 GFYU01019348.1:71-2149(-)
MYRHLVFARIRRQCHGRSSSLILTQSARLALEAVGGGHYGLQLRRVACVPPGCANVVSSWSRTLPSHAPQGITVSTTMSPLARVHLRQSTVGVARNTTASRSASAAVTAAGLGVTVGLVVARGGLPGVSLCAHADSESVTGSHDTVSNLEGDVLPLVNDASSADTPDTSLVARWIVTAHTCLVGVCNTTLQLARGLQLLVTFSPFMVTLPVAYLCGSDWMLQRSYDILAWCLQMAGPTFIKLGQWASARPDLFPEDLCRVLQRLQSSNSSHSYSHSVKSIEKAFSKQLRKEGMRLELSEDVAGSGCIAQVHTGVLRDMVTGHGQRVAVKILHPSIRSRMHRDLTLMRFVAEWVELLPFAEWYSVVEITEVFSHMMYEQLDLSVEADHLVRFADNFADMPSVVFPTPVEGLVSPKVLCETFMPGHAVSDLLLEENPTNNHTADNGGVSGVSGGGGASGRGVEGEASYSVQEKKQIASIGLNAFLKMMLDDNYIHADLHPGNILVQRHPVSSSTADGGSSTAGGGSRITKTGAVDHGSKFTLVFLDAGLTTSLKPRDKQNFRDLFLAVALGDGYEAARLILVNAPREKCPDMEAFGRDMQEIVGYVHKHRFALGEIAVGDVFQRIVTLSYRHKVQLETQFVNLVVGIVVLEGLGRQLDPNVNLIAGALPKLLRSSTFKCDVAESDTRHQWMAQC